MDFGFREGSWNQSLVDTEDQLSFGGVRSHTWIFNWPESLVLLTPTLFKGQLNFMLFEVLYLIYLVNDAG